VAWIRGQREFWQTQEISLTQAKIIEHGLAHYQAEVDWLEKFLQDLTAAQPTNKLSLKRESQSNVS
jgi:hypothetical protein